MRKKFVLCLAAVILSSTSVTLGYVMGSSNFSSGAYPSFADNINRPHKPNTNNRYAAQTYSSEVEQYVREAKRYVEFARNDIRRIQESMDEVRIEVNSVVSEYNEYIRDRN